MLRIRFNTDGIALPGRGAKMYVDGLFPGIALRDIFLADELGNGAKVIPARGDCYGRK